MTESLKEIMDMEFDQERVMGMKFFIIYIYHEANQKSEKY